MITQFLQQILSYRVEFHVCLFSKPFIHLAFSNYCKLRGNFSFFLLQIV